MAGLETSLVMPEGPTLGRRRLMKGAGAGAVALGTLGGASIATSTAASAATFSDADIFNFALNLEYLEAEFYLRATTGQPLSTFVTTSGVGGAAGPVNGGALVPFQTPAVAYFALRIANDELAHVKVIREVLGAAAVAAPAIDFTNAFNTLAVAAGLVAPGQSFDPFADEVGFLLGSYIFEDVGVTAYAGAANLLTVPANLSYAASILAVEGFHAGAIRGYLAHIGGVAATNAISALRATLGGVPDNGTSVPGNPYNFNNVDYNGQVYRRTTEQVLNIVYGGASPTAGLFFPAGVNGLFKSTAT